MNAKKILTSAILIIIAVVFILPAVTLEFGSPANGDMDSYIIDNGQEMAGANNIVSGVVFDFRGFDTLGEATVLFTAVIGVTLIFRKRREDEEYEYE
jgi:multisubunit Na+/H+ antiporter MnhB subunit